MKKYLIILVLLSVSLLSFGQKKGNWFLARDSIITPVLKVDSIRSDSLIVIETDTVDASNVYFKVGGINQGGGDVTGAQLSDSVQSAVSTSNTYTDQELQNFSDTLTRGGVSFSRDSIYQYNQDSSIVSRSELGDSLMLRAKLNGDTTVDFNVKSVLVVDTLTLTGVVSFLDSIITGAVTLNTVMQSVDSVLINSNGVFAWPIYSSDPTPIRVGQVYWNSSLSEPRYWNGSTWVAF